MRLFSMGCNMADTTIILVTQQSLQSENLKNILMAETGMTIEILDAKKPISKERINAESILLVDLSVDISKDNIDIIKNRSDLRGTILLNLLEDLEPEELIKWPYIKGVFGAKDNIDKLCRGIEAIARGDNWLPRRLMMQLISYYEEKGGAKKEEPQLDIELTRREIQVLQFLKAGGSNMEIADSLFISEHTIKSHLYNIFRKIDVKNRTQATAWAKRNL
ncbi:helix-turn-helix transcriptional regulator [Vibrio vulnificus]|nr:helix-turn-helix transcriptional regulator [Vibrio vulnificus]EKK9988422.1 helix-turn-helix transcriptional regulator [Vibrio vulnificus]